MRLATWNCRVGGFREKSRSIAPLRPGILAVQELESLDDVLVFGGEAQPTYRDRTSTSESRRSTGMFSYADIAIRAVDLDEPALAFRRYEVLNEGVIFQVASVWTYATGSQATSYRQVHDALRQHRDWIRRSPTVILGDFNANASYQGNNWDDLRNLLESLHLSSAYHVFFREPFGAETRPTHFHLGKKDSGFHLDYCFIPDAWTRALEDVNVGTYQDWHLLSDHVPLIVDVALAGPT